MFSAVCSLLIQSQERNMIPILGGGMNCRYGNLNEAIKQRGFLYEENVDTANNNQGRTFGIDLCNAGNIAPLNHLIGKRKNFPGDFTYFKADKKSQIDYVCTNRIGVNFIDDFVIPEGYWHISDH